MTASTTEQERAEFEVWARDRYPSIDLTRDGDDYSKALAKDYWSLWQAARRAPAAPVPQGWKLVPIESTEKMQRAIAAQFCGTASEALAAWYEALAAAPQPPEEPLVPSIAVTPEMVEAANEAYCPFGDMELALCAALQVAPIPPGAAPVQLPENIREGEPYDNPAFEALARSLGVWGTAQSAVCAQFWIAAKEQST